MEDKIKLVFLHVASICLLKDSVESNVLSISDNSKLTIM